MAFDEAVFEASKRHSRPGPHYGYGTAGFRMNAELLPAIVFRVGLLAGLRSRKLNGQTVGIMITASHNPPTDNGIKLVDPHGEMLEAAWEAYATDLANAPTDRALVDVYNKIFTFMNLRPATKASVIFARDTRISGPELVAALKDGLEATNVSYVDYNLLTTPQLHYLVKCIATKGTQYAYGDVSELGYYEKLSSGFKEALGNKKPQGTLVVDCANGIGGPKLHELLKHIDSTPLSIRIVNDNVQKFELLNVKCGADFVKTNQTLPAFSKDVPLERVASFDGDADRIIYYFRDQMGFHLLDGDRIAILAAAFILDLIKSTGLGDELTMGIVQTAYANGAATKYVKDGLKMEVMCTATGVKHLHHAAQRFDVGVYFEANGHGTVLFSDSALKTITDYPPKSPAQLSAKVTLRGLAQLINQTVGDAISDMLMVEVILAHKGWTMREWLNLYTDLPNKQRAISVRDRSIFKTYDAERRLESPVGLQGKIDYAVSQYANARAFVRASGTEDKVRIYAEARNRTEMEDLWKKVEMLVLQHQ